MYTGKRMKKLILAFVIAAFLLIIVPAQATIYVGGEAGVATISEAIEKASENETIIVYEGIYRENVVIDKPVILKASGNVTIEAVDNSQPVVWINTNSTFFSGFNVKGGYVGILLDNVWECGVEDNSVFENNWGILLGYGSDNSILNNIAFKNDICGIGVKESWENEVSSNIVNQNSHGFVLLESNNNKIKDNTACKYGDQGIFLEDSSGNKVSNNIVNQNSRGIKLSRSNNNKITNSTVCENGRSGIDLEDSSGNDIDNNSVNRNLYGIVFFRSNNKAI